MYDVIKRMKNDQQDDWLRIKVTLLLARITWIEFKVIATITYSL